MKRAARPGTWKHDLLLMSIVVILLLGVGWVDEIIGGENGVGNVSGRFVAVDKLYRGEQVVFVSDWLRNKCVGWYPKPGVVGVVMEVRGDGMVVVKWPPRSTTRPDAPWATLRENLMKYTDYIGEVSSDHGEKLEPV